jgi:hypothetical protein
MLLGVGLFGAITATITSYLIATGKPVTATPLTQLRELARLRDDGIIDETEFDATKARLLSALETDGSVTSVDGRTTGL